MDQDVGGCLWEEAVVKGSQTFTRNTYTFTNDCTPPEFFNEGFGVLATLLITSGQIAVKIGSSSGAPVVFGKATIRGLSDPCEFLRSTQTFSNEVECFDPTDRPFSAGGTISIAPSN
jgi:hypothetical protein